MKSLESSAIVRLKSHLQTFKNSLTAKRCETESKQKNCEASFKLVTLGAKWQLLATKQDINNGSKTELLRSKHSEEII